MRPSLLLLALLLPLPALGQPASTPSVTTVPDRGYVPLVETPLELDDKTRHYLLWYARQACEGAAGLAALVPPPALAEARRPIIITLFHERGTRRVRRRVDGPATLPEKLRATVPEMCAGLSPADRQAHYLHLMVLSRTVRLPNFGAKGLFDNRVFEPQVMGLAFEYKGKRSERDPIDQVMYNHGSRSLRRSMSEDLGLNAGRIVNDPDVTVEMYEVIHLGERYPDHAYTEFFRGFEKLTAEQVTPDLLLARLKLIAEWYKHNVRDGEVTYQWLPAKLEEAESKRTMVRSTMSVWILNRLAWFLDDPELKRLGQVTIDFYRERYAQMTESKAQGHLVPSPKPLRNGNLAGRRYTTLSFLAAAMMERDDFAEHRDEIEMLLDYAMSKMRPDGVMWVESGISQYFMPGQLLLVVSYAARKLGDPKYKAFFDRAFATYGPAIEGQLALSNGLWTPYAPAWYTQPFVDMYMQAPDERLPKLVFGINDRVARYHDLNANFEVASDYDGALTPKRGYYGNNSVTAAALESITDAAILAKKLGDTQRLANYKRVIRSAVAYLLRLQYTPANTYGFRQRERIIGGFKQDLLNQTSWMDNVWHLTSAFMKIHQNGLLDP